MPTLGYRRALVAAAAVALALGGCGSGESVRDAPGESPAQAEVDTIDPTGVAVKLDKPPQAAMGFYSTDVDILATLGFTMNDTQPIRSGYDKLPEFFPATLLDTVNTTFVNFPEFNFDAIAQAEPDFIVSSFGFDEDATARLNEVAPTYSFSSSSGATWLANFEKTAADLSRTAQYAEWLETYEDAGDKAEQAIAEAGLDDMTVMPLDFRQDQLQIGCHNGLSCLALENAGMKVYEGSRERDVPLSLENLGDLREVDAVWIPTDGGTRDDEGFIAMMKLVEGNPIWDSLPFVRNGRIYTYDTEMSFGSPSGALAFIKKLQTDLVPSA